MGSEWNEQRLEDCMDAIIDYRGKTPKKTGCGVPLITAKIIKKGRILPVSEYIAEEDYEDWMRRGIPLTGDVVLTTEAPLGEVAQLDGRKIALAQRVITLRGKEDFLDNTFLKYLLMSHDVQHQLDGRGTGTTVKGIKQSELREVMLIFPEFGEQKAIAHVLGALDDRIELNRRMNETLEAMAQALFKGWFVDFDPVIDNALARGKEIPEDLRERAAARAALGDKRKPLPEEIRTLFPDEFTLSDELGWIPEGWEVKDLPDVIDFLEGPGIRNWQYTDDEDGIKFINIRCIQNGDLKLDTANKLTREEAFGKYVHFQLSVDDIVISTSGTLGRYAFIRNSHLPLSLNTSVIRFRKIEGISTLHYIAGYVETKLQRELEMRATGSAQLNFGPMHLKQIKMLVPAIQLLEVHNADAHNIFRKRQSNLDNIDLLTNLRDTLLPKLISGELRIPDAEKMVEELN